MDKSTRILLAEDSEVDAEMAQREIRKALPASIFERVETRNDFLTSLEAYQPDIIISDYNMPSFDGMTALKLARELTPLTPVIIWTGSLSEDVAADCMKAGASNYVIKENIKRLGPAVVHALEEKLVHLERQQAEESLRESEQRYRRLFNNAPLGIFQSTAEGKFTSVNPALARMLGYDSPEDTIEGIKDIATDLYVDPNRRAEIIHLLMENPELITLENVYRRKDGSTFIGNLNAQPIMDSDGHLLSIEGIVEDVTDRKQAEEALQSKEAQIRTLSDNLPNGYMYQIDFGLQGETRRFNYISAGVEKLHGISVQQVLDDVMTLYGQMLEEDRAMATEEEAEAFASMGTFRIEAQFRTVSGQIRWLLLTSTPRKLNNQHIVWDGIALDISERKQAEDALRENENKLRVIFETMSEGVALNEIIYNEDGEMMDYRILDVNQAFYKLADYEHKDVIGSLATEIYAMPPEIIKTFWETHRAQKEVQHTIMPSPITQKYYYVSTSPFINNQFITTFFDITERMLAEEKVKASLLEKETMLKEIHHRVKNNLQVITSLLYLQSRTSTDEHTQSMFSDSQNRIASMALIHEKLYQSEDLAHIAFGDYIHDLGHSLIHTYGMDHSRVTIAVEADEISLDINNAVPCGLIINEIISNSLKYAFPDQRKGNIRVTFSLEPADRFTLTLSDDGVGLPADMDLRAAKSLGTKLILRLAEQIQGTMERTSSDQGTHYVITFPRTV